MLIVANQKMYRTPKETARLIRKVETGLVGAAGKVQVVVCPTFPGLSLAKEAASKIKIGAQDCHYKQLGQFTGDVSPKSLKEVGCKYIILGHSERRANWGETNEFVNAKAKAVLRNGMKIILCVGEPRSVRVLGTTKSYIKKELREGLEGISKDYAKDVVIAYEPIWAISPGGPDTPEDAFVIARLIRDFLKERFGKQIGKKPKVLYGGSINAKNAKSFTEDESIDGLLVGKASTDAKSLLEIIEKVKNKR